MFFSNCLHLSSSDIVFISDVDLVLSLSINSCWKSICTFISLDMSSKSISVKSLLQEHEFHDHVNSYFLHASKLSDSCYKLFHGFFRLYINFFGDSLRILEIRSATLADDVIQYSMSFENNPKSQKNKNPKKPRMLKFQKVQASFQITS